MHMPNKGYGVLLWCLRHHTRGGVWMLRFPSSCWVPATHFAPPTSRRSPAPGPARHTPALRHRCGASARTLRRRACPTLATLKPALARQTSCFQCQQGRRKARFRDPYMFPKTWCYKPMERDPKGLSHHQAQQCQPSPPPHAAHSIGSGGTGTDHSCRDAPVAGGWSIGMRGAGASP